MQTCDQCGPAVSAKYIASLPNGGILTWCGHCSDLNAVHLEEIGGILIPLGVPE